MILYCSFVRFVRASALGCLRGRGFGLVLCVLVRGCQLAWWEWCGSAESGVCSCEDEISVCSEFMDGQ